MNQKIINYIRSDYYRYYGVRVSFLRMFLLALTAKNFGFTYLFWLRLCKNKSILYPVARIMHYRLSRKYGIHIKRETKIGYGLYLGHSIGIVINPGTIIGNNCNLSQFLSIGTNNKTPATIGDNVYLGPNVCVVEDVHIGDNSTIGAGSVVVKDVPANVIVAGVPAKVISSDSNARYIKNKFEL